MTAIAKDDVIVSSALKSQMVSEEFNNWMPSAESIHD
jgi:hypothetical protein